MSSSVKTVYMFYYYYNFLIIIFYIKLSRINIGCYSTCYTFVSKNSNNSNNQKQPVNFVSTNKKRKKKQKVETAQKKKKIRLSNQISGATAPCYKLCNITYPLKYHAHTYIIKNLICTQRRFLVY